MVYFEYYCANYAMIVLAIHTSSDKIVYVRHFRAEMGGGITRLCGQCVCITKNPRTYYDFGSKKTPKVYCVVCFKQPLL